MKIGTLDINSCKIGSTQINEVRIGSTLVWSYSSFDPDAQLFITNAAITDTTQQTAVNNLVVALKGYGIWSKMKALYPFVGGTAAQHKFNLKNPLDTDAAFRLVFNGGWTHSSTGALPNGTNAFANTFLVPSIDLALNSIHLNYYSRTNVFENQIEIGVDTAAGKTIFLCYSYSGNGLKVLNSTNTGFSGTSFSPTNGMLIGNRISSTTEKYYYKGNLVDTLSKNSVGISTDSIYVGAVRVAGNNAAYFSSKQCALASIGDGLTDIEAANYYTAVQNFQVTLSRNI